MTQKTAIILALFNGDEYRVRMLKAVIGQLRLQRKVPHIVVGILGGMADLPVDQVVAVSGDSLLFQKDAIWNAAARALPRSIENIIFLDADTFAIDVDWVSSVESRLERFDVLQGYSVLFYLTREATDGVLRAPSDSYKHQDLVDDSQLVFNNRPAHTASVPVAHPSFGFVGRYGGGVSGAAGGCWVFRRSVFEKIGGFPSEEIFGGLNDLLLVHRLSLVSKLNRNLFTDSLFDMYREQIPGLRFSFVPRRHYHLYHKSGADREYGTRATLARSLGYDPSEDIEFTESGGIVLTERGSRLRDALKGITERNLRPDVV